MNLLLPPPATIPLWGHTHQTRGTRKIVVTKDQPAGVLLQRIRNQNS